MSHENSSTRAVVAALGANLLIALLKFVAAFVTGSVATLAEAVHSVADTGNQGLLLVGDRLGKRGPTEKHPFGRAVERYFWPFVVSILLFSVGGLFAVYEGVHKLTGHDAASAHTHHASNLWNYVVLGASFLLESYSCTVAMRAFRKQRGSMGFFEALNHAKDPTIPVVLLEDLGALLGLTIALTGIFLADLTGWGGWDGLGSLLIGVLLCFVAVFLSRKTHSLLVGESASAEERGKIKQVTEATPGVMRLVQLLSVYRGPDDVLIALKVAFDRGMPVERVEETIDLIEEQIRGFYPQAKWIFIEPDAKYDARQDDRPLGSLMPD
ncbi:MAG: cation diffusion facilitator family transporter [Deltaproteobacteria bacterium]